MNRVNGLGALLRELHGAETELADSFRAVAERQVADHGTHYPCRTLSGQCDRHAEQIRAWGDRFEVTLRAPKRSALSTARDALRHTSGELTGRRAESGLILLRDLRELYVQAENTSIHWIMLGQAAQALRDQDLLAHVPDLHKETLTQARWVKTRIKEAAPQILVAP